MSGITAWYLTVLFCPDKSHPKAARVGTVSLIKLMAAGHYKCNWWAGHLMGMCSCCYLGHMHNVMEM